MMTTVEVYACFTVKIYKNNPPKIQTGRAPGAPVLDPHLLLEDFWNISIVGIFYLYLF